MRCGFLKSGNLVKCWEQERRDPLWNDNLIHRSCQVGWRHTYLLQRYRERIEKLSQQDRLIKICTDATDFHSSHEMLEERTVRPVSEQPAGLFTQHTDKFVIDDDDMDYDTAAESNFSLKSRSFLHRVNDRVRKILDQSSTDTMQDSNKHSSIWTMFMSSTLEASVFIVKNYSEILHSIKNTGNNLTMKQMFDISEKLTVGQSDEIYGVTPINWEDSSWKQLPLVTDEEVISLSHAKVYVFSDFVFCLGKVNQNPTSNNVWEEKLSWFKSSPQYSTLDTIDGEPMEFEWNIFPGFAALQLCHKVQEFMTKMSDPSEFKGRIIFTSMFNDISWGSKDNEQECNANADLVSICKKIPTRKMVIPRTWIRKEVAFYSCWQTTRRMGQSCWIDDDQIRRKRTPSFQCHESIVPRNAQKQRRWKIINTLETVFRTIISVTQLSIYGAVSDLCDEYRICQARTVRLVLAEQSDPLFEPASLLMKTPTPSTEDPAQEDLLQKAPRTSGKALTTKPSDQNLYWCRQQLKSDSTSWQKDTEEFSRFGQQMENHLTRKVGFEGTPTLGPC